MMNNAPKIKEFIWKPKQELSTYSWESQKKSFEEYIQKTEETLSSIIKIIIDKDHYFNCLVLRSRLHSLGNKKANIIGSVNLDNESTLDNSINSVNSGIIDFKQFISGLDALEVIIWKEKISIAEVKDLVQNQFSNVDDIDITYLLENKNDVICSRQIFDDIMLELKRNYGKYWYDWKIEVETNAMLNFRLQNKKSTETKAVHSRKKWLPIIGWYMIALWWSFDYDTWSNEDLLANLWMSVKEFRKLSLMSPTHHNNDFLDQPDGDFSLHMRIPMDIK